MLKDQRDLLIPVYLICVQNSTTKNEKTKLLFLDAVSVSFHPGIPKSYPSTFQGRDIKPSNLAPVQHISS